MQKRPIKMLTLAMLLCITILLPSQAMKASDLSANYTWLKTIRVEDITDVMSVTDPGTSISKNCIQITKKGTYYDYYAFSIAESSYVNIKAYADIVDTTYRSTADFYLSTSKLFTGEKIVDMNLKDDMCEYNTALEAGTYYLKVKMNVADDSYTTTKLFNLGIYTEPVLRTGKTKGTTMKKAIVTGNKTSYGLITESSKKQYFKFTVGTKSDVKLTTILNNPLKWEDATAGVQLYNANGAKIGYEHNIDSQYENSTTISVKGLAKGTYYVCVFNLYTDQFFNVRQSISIKDIYAPSTPKVSSLKKGAKAVKGTGEAGVRVYVVYNKKTYMGTVSSKGAFNVKVPALKSGSTVSVYLKDAVGNKSSTKKIKVK